MKTSKIIFISFFAVIGLFLLSLLMQTEKNNIKFGRTAVSLPPFNHLVLNEIGNINVILLTTDSVSVRHNPSTTAIMPNYHVKGDTLFVTWPHSQNEMQWDKTITCSKLRSITLKRSIINLSGFDTDSLNICANSNSYLQCNLGLISLVNIELSHSEVYFNSGKIKHLQATVRDSANLSTWKVLQTNVTVDETSHYYSR